MKSLFGVARSRARTAESKFDLHGFVRTLPEIIRAAILFDPCREGEQDLPFSVAAFDFADLRRDEKRRLMHRALAREHPATSMHQRATQRSHIQPHRHLIGKTGEHAALRSRPGALARLHIETFLTGDPEKLLRKAGRLRERRPR